MVNFGIMRIILYLAFACIHLRLVSCALDSRCVESSDFECTFESDCPCWRQGENSKEDDIDWVTGTQVAILGWNSIPRGRSEINSTFAYAVRDGQHLFSQIPRGAILISQPIPCLEKPATLKVWYWKAAFIPQIRVCYKYTDKPDVIECSAEVNGFQPPDWLPLVATLPAIKKEFQIVIQAIRLFGLQTVVAIDDISLEGDLTCKNVNSTLIQSASKKNQSEKINTSNDLPISNPLVKPKFCPNVKLSDSWSGDYNRGVWQPCENGTNCKQQTGVGSATAWVVQGEGTYVLETQDFHLDSPSILRFQYEFAEKSFTSKLRLCVDKLDTCPFVTRGSSQVDKWSDQEIPLIAGLHKIYFTVTNLRKTDKIKVRRINVRTKEDNPDTPSPDKCTLLLTLIDE